MRQTFQLATSILKITWVSVFLPRSGYYCSNSIIIWEHYSVNGDVFDIQNNYFFGLFFPFFFVEIFFCREKNFTSLMDQRRSCKRISLLFIHKSHWMGNCWKMRRTNTKKNQIRTKTTTWKLILIYHLSTQRNCTRFPMYHLCLFCTKWREKNVQTDCGRLGGEKKSSIKVTYLSAEAKIKYLYVENCANSLGFISYGLNYALYPKVA